MSAKADNKKTETSAPPQEINFKCKCCGETKPLSDLVVMRQYYPAVSVCKVCARGSKNTSQEPE
jgi:hypothetical protein